MYNLKHSSIPREQIMTQRHSQMSLVTVGIRVTGNPLRAGNTVKTRSQMPRRNIGTQQL